MLLRDNASFGNRKKIIPLEAVDRNWLYLRLWNRSCKCVCSGLLSSYFFRFFAFEDYFITSRSGDYRGRRRSAASSRGAVAHQVVYVENGEIAG
jgi:hypothetical protein